LLPALFAAALAAGPTDTVVVVDVSPGATTSDPAALRTVVGDFLAWRARTSPQGDRGAVVTFAGEARLVAPLMDVATPILLNASDDVTPCEQGVDAWYRYYRHYDFSVQPDPELGTTHGAYRFLDADGGPRGRPVLEIDYSSPEGAYLRGQFPGVFDVAADWGLVELSAFEQCAAWAASEQWFLDNHPLASASPDLSCHAGHPLSGSNLRIDPGAARRVAPVDCTPWFPGDVPGLPGTPRFGTGNATDAPDRAYGVAGSAPHSGLAMAADLLANSTNGRVVLITGNAWACPPNLDPALLTACEDVHLDRTIAAWQDLSGAGVAVDVIALTDAGSPDDLRLQRLPIHGGRYLRFDDLAGLYALTARLP
jgi:hypothetical protein